MTHKDRKAILEWNGFVSNLEKQTLTTESPEQRKVRIENLLGNFEAFCQYYFPDYSTPFAAFQLRFAQAIIDTDRIYIVRAWASEHGKSAVAGLFVPLFLKFNKRLFNGVFVSDTKEKAVEFLQPLMASLESNERIIADFGTQKTKRNWKSSHFITSDGVSFRAIGVNQTAKHLSNEEKRPDFILIDDVDAEEDKNTDRTQRKWDWIEPLIPAMSIIGLMRFVVVGNIIHKNGVVVRASRMADDYEQIDILDSEGNPSWSARYSLEQVNYMLSKISFFSAQKEYFNNPISAGSVFKEMTWAAVPPLNKFKFLVVYTDPSFKESKHNDFKATVLIGELNGNFYIIKAFVEQTSTKQMVEWHYDIRDFVADKTSVYYFIEANFMQDTFLQNFQDAGKTRGYIPMQGDDRHKPDKFSRIESTLEPLNRQSKLILNEAERNNPHMMRLEEQFLAIEPSLPVHDDGPDAVEGAVYIINNKLKLLAPIAILPNRKNKNRY